MPTVYRNVGEFETIHTVKNLGWLLRHASEVDRLLVEVCLSDGRLYAYLTIKGRPTEFHCEFASGDVLLSWIKRPSLRAIPTQVEDFR